MGAPKEWLAASTCGANQMDSGEHPRSIGNNAGTQDDQKEAARALKVRAPHVTKIGARS